MRNRRNRFLLRETSRIFNSEISCEQQFITPCCRKVEPKMLAGHLRRDRTKDVTERSRKIFAVCARSLRAFPPLPDPFPSPVQCGIYGTLRAIMIIYFLKIPTRRSAASYSLAEVCGARPQRRASAGRGFGPRGAKSPRYLKQDVRSRRSQRSPATVADAYFLRTMRAVDWVVWRTKTFGV